MGESVEKNNLKFIADSDGEFMRSSGLMNDLSAAGLRKKAFEIFNVCG